MLHLRRHNAQEMNLNSLAASNAKINEAAATAARERCGLTLCNAGE
jgi:hypothetical protein